jgi:hypothetical protein
VPSLAGYVDEVTIKSAKGLDLLRNNAKQNESNPKNEVTVSNTINKSKPLA